MTGVRKKKKSMLSLETALELSQSGLGVSCPLEENRPKQYLLHPAAVRKAPGSRLEMTYLADV